MKSVLLFGSAVVGLAGCCAPEQEPISYFAPYSDIAPVPPEKFSRRYVEVLASSAWRSGDDSKVRVCGRLGSRSFQPGVTVESVLKRVHLKVPSFYHVAVWRPKDAAFYGVRVENKQRVEPSLRALSTSDRLLAGDVVIILEKTISF